MEALSRQQLMACLSLSETLWRSLVPWIPQLNLSEGDSLSMNCWVSGIQDYLNSTDKMPNRHQLEIAVQPHLLNLRGTADQATLMGVMLDLQNASALLAGWTNSNPDQYLQLGRDLLATYLKERIAASYAVRLQRAPGQATKLANDLSTALAAVDGSISIAFRTQFPDGYFPARPEHALQPVGISFIDKMLGGGLLAGEAVGHAAPIGQGKTTLVSQISYSRAMTVLAGRFQDAMRLGLPDINWTNLPQVYFCVYENVENLLASYISNAAYIPREVTQAAMLAGKRSASPFTSRHKQDWRGYELKQWREQFDHCRQQHNRNESVIDWPAGEQERFDNTVRVIDSMIRVIDFSGHDHSLVDYAVRGVEGIRDYIKAHQDSIGNPGVSFVAVDFVGALVDQAVSAGKIKMADRTDTIRMIPQVIGREIGAGFKTPVWIAHQLNPSENKKGLGTVPDPHATEGSGMFLTYCAVGIASGRLSRDNIAVFVLGKQRRMQTSNMDMQLGRLSSEFAMWTQADNYVLVDNQIMNRNQVYGGLKIPPAGVNQDTP